MQAPCARRSCWAATPAVAGGAATYQRNGAILDTLDLGEQALGIYCAS